MGFSRPEYWSGLPFPSPGDLPRPGIEPGSPALAGGLFTTEAPGEPKKTAVGCHSLLQVIFLTQELNWGLLHCRQILDHLSHLRLLEWNGINIYIHVHTYALTAEAQS